MFIFRFNMKVIRIQSGFVINLTIIFKVQFFIFGFLFTKSVVYKAINTLSQHKIANTIFVTKTIINNSEYSYKTLIKAFSFL